ncbi:DUF2809 domain-containing protein [Mucilaginibacter daejeonensis]|uniref:ribosomal maturation YjgA family protein n=1 Tax=Mucilaginibacter daejeonensis TaxID=398049 RepID=UPI001D17D0E0|nr:DUF2809 domain-containing protein [Mucilaginibacter daejeonensis]UEG53063.1 DUF2809 domain-containing protein [Mucilaginibacter daejeonensis]
MLKKRLIYALLIITVIIAGLASRRVTAIPLWIGDLLWALMVYLIVRFLFIRSTIKKVAVISLAFCFAIEFSQLYHAPWIDALRQTLFGKLVLGSGFLWGDLLAYMAGVAIGVISEYLALKEERRR